MEIRQLRYFVRIVETGGFGRAARDLGLATATLSQQISVLESELSTRLLHRTPAGTTPTDAGLAFFRQARLALRHFDATAVAAQNTRSAGQVSVGLAPTTASVLALPLVEEMQRTYPNVRVHIVESLSGHLATMLSARHLDLAILFNHEDKQNWVLSPLLTESLYLIAAPDFPGFPGTETVTLSEISDLPLVLPTQMHGLRSTLVSAGDALGKRLNVVMEIDSLAVLMALVRQSALATIQPGAAVGRADPSELLTARLVEPPISRQNYLACLPDEELSWAALAARLVVRRVVDQLLERDLWKGAARLR